MLGELIEEVTGKISGQRVLDAEGPTLETSVTTTGTMKGVQVTELLTFVSRPWSEGALHGIGHGIITSADGETATFTGEGMGKFESPGKLKWRGALFFKTKSEGKLNFLNNLVGVFEGEGDAQGNFMSKTWEWK